jgi:maleate isomerase
VRLALLTPFMPVGDAAARRIFEEAGHAVLRVESLRAPGPAAIARIPRARIAAALRALDGADVEAIMQVGTNLPFAAIARAAERERGKPVLASNPVSYWHALRALGIAERAPQHGRLFAL